MIKWGFWRKDKEVSTIAEERRKPSEIVEEFFANPIAQDKSFLSDVDRVAEYRAGGGKILDLTNRPRKEHDGFPPDQEMMHPWKEAHTGMKEGLNRAMKGERR